MTSSILLGQLSDIHENLQQLLESVPEADAYRCWHSALPPLAWLYGRAVWLEAYWLRERLMKDSDLTDRVRELFDGEAGPEIWTRLPPRDHLLNWALEIQDENLMRLANPRLLPASPLLAGNRLAVILVQEQERIYERMLQVLVERRLASAGAYRAGTAPVAGLPVAKALVEISKGHYRMGAKEPEGVFDNELPEQVAELSSFRMQRRPLSNGEFLAFIESGGYADPAWWDETGWAWRNARMVAAPHSWRRDEAGVWYGVGLNGPFDLGSDDPLLGISHHEATAYARWLGAQGGDLEGAVVQHEYQWEVAVRTQAVKEFGRVWEWCSAPFHPYSDFRPAAEGLGATEPGAFDGDRFPLRGGSLYTQRSLRRASYRNHAPAEANWVFGGTRLVFPPM